ncbi:MAG: HNH endonuclease [Dissulfurispiraceae bacterium]|jgi:5-methylcytosine-specific restriction endonuclease McrA
MNEYNIFPQFVINMTEGEIKKERSIARDLRNSTWWKRKCAGGTCYYCNANVPAKMLTMDHIVPVARGGRSVKSNIVTACKTCNNKKKYLLPIEWEEYIRGLG